MTDGGKGQSARRKQMETYEQMIRDRRLNATDLRVGWRIIDRMGDSNISWPSHQRIAGELGCTRQTVQRSTARLEAFGYLLIVPGGGRGRSHSYGLSGDNVRDDGQFQETARSEESVRGLTQNCPRPSALSVRGDGHESPHEPSKDPPQGSAPIGAGGLAPADGLQEMMEIRKTLLISGDGAGMKDDGMRALLGDCLKLAGFEPHEVWGVISENWREAA